LNFIKLFGQDEKFINGLCYWFAYILKGRFPDGEIWYDQIMNHFYFVYDGDAYDVNGLECLPTSAIKWSEYEGYDKLDCQRVVKYCVLKEGD
jgi:hypothetical protein